MKKNILIVIAVMLLVVSGFAKVEYDANFKNPDTTLVKNTFKAVFPNLDFSQADRIAQRIWEQTGESLVLDEQAVKADTQVYKTIDNSAVCKIDRKTGDVFYRKYKKFEGSALGLPKKGNAKGIAKKYLESLGLFKKDHIRAIMSMDRVSAEFRKVHNRDWTEEDIDKMFTEFVPMQMKCLPEYASLIPGVPETINLVREKYGVTVGSSTGFNQEMNELLLSEANKQGYNPDVCTSSSQVKKGRPYWYMVEENMRLAGVTDPEEVLKVGDTRGDMQEGKAMAKVASSGTWTLGLSATGNYVGKTWQELEDTSGHTLQQEIFSTEQILYKAGADYVVTNITSLPEIIEVINQRLAAGEKPRAIALDYLEE